jgi:putative endonuclease
VKTSKQIIGSKGEDAAVKYLCQKDYVIHHRNYRIGRAEVDIVAEIDRIYVFVEVKTRSTKSFGFPESFVTDRQKNILIDAASTYTSEYQYIKSIRFDIISVLLEPSKCTVSHFEDAFWPIA